MVAGLRRSFVLLLAALSCAGQSTEPVPVFNEQGIGAYGRNAKVLAPGMVLMLYGQHLASDPVCGKPAVQPALELCRVRVLIGATPAELLFVSSGQINFKIPMDVPENGFAPVRVCVGAVCSEPLQMWFSTRTALLSLVKPAYVHMPVWIHVDPPPPYSVSYPCWTGPEMPSGYEFEVSLGGSLLKEKPQPSPLNWTRADSCDPLSSGALPLHLLYQFDQPGTYSVRFTFQKAGHILYQSDWTDIVVGAFSESQRNAWLESIKSELNTNNRSIVSEGIPSLLAWPDEKALTVLLRAIPPKNACTNFDCTKLAFGRAALSWFDDALLRTHVPPDRLRELCPPEGKCK